MNLDGIEKYIHPSWLPSDYDPNVGVYEYTSPLFELFVKWQADSMYGRRITAAEIIGAYPGSGRVSEELTLAFGTLQEDQDYDYALGKQLIELNDDMAKPIVYRSADEAVKMAEPYDLDPAVMIASLSVARMSPDDEATYYFVSAAPLYFETLLPKVRAHVSKYVEHHDTPGVRMYGRH